MKLGKLKQAVSAYKKAINGMKSMKDTDLVPETLIQVKGIGKSLIEKIQKIQNEFSKDIVCELYNVIMIVRMLCYLMLSSLFFRRILHFNVTFVEVHSIFNL